MPDEINEVKNNEVQPDDIMPDRIAKPFVGKYFKPLRYKEQLYDGHLGRMKYEDYVLPIVPEYKPIHAKPYPVPKASKTRLGSSSSIQSASTF